jgi:transcriptional regulator with XRE-family HTH domain
MLGDKVKILRQEMKITQQNLAIAIGVSQSTIGMIEGNKQGASNDTLIKLANALNTTVDYLLSDNIEKLHINHNNKNYDNKNNDLEIKDDDIRRIERARRKMDPKNKAKMMKILRSAFDEYFDD